MVVVDAEPPPLRDDELLVTEDEPDDDEEVVEAAESSFDLDDSVDSIEADRDRRFMRLFTFMVEFLLSLGRFEHVV